jgi:hypothetical protein
MRNFISAYWKRRVQTDQIRRTSIIDEQRQAQEKRQQKQEETNHREIIASLKKISDSHNTYANDHRAEDCYRRTWERKRFRLDIAGVAVAAAAAVFLLWQQHSMQGQLVEMQKSYGPLRDTAKAAEEQATQNRARIWIEINDRGTNVLNVPASYVSLALSFKITNYGASPAIITAVIFHLFWTLEEPDPLAPDAQKLHETAVWPADLGAGVGSLPDFVMTRGVAANTSITVQKWFNFIPEGNYHTMLAKRVWQWFYAVVQYRDIYDLSRETSFYGRPEDGQPSERYPQYNYHH